MATTSGSFLSPFLNPGGSSRTPPTELPSGAVHLVARLLEGQGQRSPLLAPAVAELLQGVERGPDAEPAA